MKGEVQEGFWRLPPPWVWLVFCLAMGVLSASMLTLREGRRFVSRRLGREETRIVMAALKLWDPAGRDPDALRLREMLGRGELLAMASPSFSRAEERSTFGYTDEHQRLLLNPNLCFANQRLCGPSVADPADVVATMCTLYHESRHLFHEAPEAVAYEDEWRLARQRGSTRAGHPRTDLARSFEEWEQEMPGRVQLYVGEAMVEKIRARVDSPAAPPVLGSRPPER